LIAINIAVFILLQSPFDPNAGNAFTMGYSVIPQEIRTGEDIVRAVPVQTPRGTEQIPHAPGPSPIHLTILTAMFMHGGWMHLIGNMLYLWIFGDNVEDAMGHVKFLIFYLLCGLAATVAHIMFNLSGLNAVIPSLGASGAIAGVLGGYLVLFPTRSVRVFVGYLGIIAMPAIIVIGGWIAVQVMSGIGSIAPNTEEGGGGVAYMAHVGGAVAGLILVWLFRNREVVEHVQQRIHQYPLGNSYRDYRNY
jgi:membrane associated rhomboid family serine protease